MSFSTLQTKQSQGSNEKNYYDHELHSESQDKFSVWQVILCGFTAQMSWHKTLKYFAQLQEENSISAKLCFFLNGVLYMGSILIFDNAITNLFDYIALGLSHLEIMLSKYTKHVMPLDSSYPHAPSDMLMNFEQWRHVNAFVQDASYSLFKYLWLVP